MRFENKTFKTGKNFTKCSFSVKGGEKFVALTACLDIYK